MSDLGNKEIMSKNIQYYMNKFGVNRRKLSTDLNIKYTTLSDWINAKTYPRIDKIELLANYFNIQKADLVEENNNQPPPDILPLDRRIATNIKEMRIQKQLSRENIADKMRISVQEITSYEEQQKTFTVDIVFNFAEALNVTFDDLFPTTTTEHFDEIPTILKLNEKNNTIVTASGQKYVVGDKEMQQAKDFLTFLHRR